jgi:hypothetical protein
VLRLFSSDIACYVPLVHQHTALMYPLQHYYHARYVQFLYGILTRVLLIATSSFTIVHQHCHYFQFPHKRNTRHLGSERFDRGSDRNHHSIHLSDLVWQSFPPEKRRLLIPIVEVSFGTKLSTIWTHRPSRRGHRQIVELSSFQSIIETIATHSHPVNT